MYAKAAFILVSPESGARYGHLTGVRSIMLRGPTGNRVRATTQTARTRHGRRSLYSTATGVSDVSLLAVRCSLSSFSPLITGGRRPVNDVK